MVKSPFYHGNNPSIGLGIRMCTSLGGRGSAHHMAAPHSGHRSSPELSDQYGGCGMTMKSTSFCYLLTTEPTKMVLSVLLGVTEKVLSYALICWMLRFEDFAPPIW